MSKAPKHIQVVQPDGWPRPSGYCNGMSARGRMVFVAGQIGWDEDQQIGSDDLTVQFRQALRNVLTVVKAAGGAASDIVRLTIYVTDLDAYRSSLAEFGAAYRDVMGKNFPVMALVGVAGFVELGAKIEIEATAVIDDGAQETA